METPPKINTYKIPNEIDLPKHHVHFMRHGNEMNIPVKIEIDYGWWRTMFYTFILAIIITFIITPEEIGFTVGKFYNGFIAGTQHPDKPHYRDVK